MGGYRCGRGEPSESQARVQTVALRLPYSWSPHCLVYRGSRDETHLLYLPRENARANGYFKSIGMNAGVVSSPVLEMRFKGDSNPGAGMACIPPFRRVTGLWLTEGATRVRSWGWSLIENGPQAFCARGRSPDDRGEPVVLLQGFGPGHWDPSRAVAAMRLPARGDRSLVRGGNQLFELNRRGFSRESAAPESLFREGDLLFCNWPCNRQAGLLRESFIGSWAVCGPGV